MGVRLLYRDSHYVAQLLWTILEAQPTKSVSCHLFIAVYASLDKLISIEEATGPVAEGYEALKTWQLAAHQVSVIFALRRLLVSSFPL